jgi:hypothetical protein
MRCHKEGRAEGTWCYRGREVKSKHMRERKRKREERERDKGRKRYKKVKK